MEKSSNPSTKMPQSLNTLKPPPQSARPEYSMQNLDYDNHFDQITSLDELPAFLKKESKSKSPSRALNMTTDDRVRPSSGQKPPMERELTFGKMGIPLMKRSLSKILLEMPDIRKTPSFGKNESDYIPEDVVELNITLEKQVTVSSIFSETYPIMLSLKFSAPKNFSRSPVDIIFALDISFSIESEEFDLMLSTVRRVINKLNEEDRVALVTFGSIGRKLFDLIETSDKNKSKIFDLVDEILPVSSKNVLEGMREAVSILKTRDQYRPVTGIFLMSDGQNPDSKATAQFIEVELVKHKIMEEYTIMTFGIGKDQNQNFLKRISSMKEGEFYPIMDSGSSEKAAYSAFDFLSSTFALKGDLDIIPIQNSIFTKNVELTNGTEIQSNKDFGWYKHEQGKLSTSINILRKESQLNFALTLKIPNILRSIKKEEKKIPIIEAQFRFQTLREKPMNISSKLIITLFQKDKKENSDLNINPEAWIELHRVNTRTIMKFAMSLADKKNYKDAQNSLLTLKNSLSTSSVKGSEFVRIMLVAINSSVKDLDEDLYVESGRKNIENRMAMLKRREIL